MKLKRILPFILMLMLPIILVLWEWAQIGRSVYIDDDYLYHVRQLKSHFQDDSMRNFYQSFIDIDMKNKNSAPVKEILAKIGVGLSVLSLLFAFFLFFKIHVDSLRARLSEKFLYANFAKNWRVVAFGLNIYIGFLILSLILAITYELIDIWSHANKNDWFWSALFFLMLFGGTIVVGLNLLYRMHKKWPIQSLPPSIYAGRKLEREMFPKLWIWIEKIATSLQAPIPDHIIIGLDDSFFVTSSDIFLQPSNQVLSGHTLYLPFPFLTSMSQEEVQAIIGHELTHFSNADTTKSSEVNTQFRLLYEYWYNIKNTGYEKPWIEIPIFWIAEFFLYRFQVSIHYWSRKQEFLADQGGAKFAGKIIFAQALLRVIAISEVLSLSEVALKNDHFMENVNEILQSTPLVIDDNTMSISTTHPFDTHPPVQSRLEHLSVNIDNDLIFRVTRKPQHQDLVWFSNLLDSEEKN